MAKKLIVVAALALAAITPALLAQSVNSVRVFSSVPGARFRVDGQMYVGSADFLWPEGSKHFIGADPQDFQWGVRYDYQGWANNLGDTDTTGAKPITADAALKSVQVNFTVSYLLIVSVAPDCPDPRFCAAPGRVESPCGTVVNASVTCYSRGGRFAAYPGPGAIFRDWMSANELSPQLRTTYIINLPINGPTSITARFTPAVAVSTTVTIQTEPQELSVIVDNTRFTPPATFEWGWDTVHTIGTDPAQRSRDVVYAFESWSDGGELNHEVRVPSPAKPMTMIARFVPAHTVRFQTSPPNLRLKIDDRQDWINYGFAWLPGSNHAVSAPETQTDVDGRKYRFVSWSNGQPRSFSYTAGPPAGDLQVVATYQLLGQATIDSVPTRLPVEIDGIACITPCAIERDAGASVRVAVAAIQNGGEQSRLVFKGWSDSAGDSRVIELSPDRRTYTANYTPQKRLSIAAAPAEGATIVADPASPDGFYDAGSVVSLTANPALGFRIRNWSGDLGGSASRAAIMVDAPKTAVLLLDRVPAIAPLGVRNAAGSATAGRVVPGSLISIFGVHLAPELLIGPANPLTQTLGSVTVRVGGSFLPLLFVSPEQINAQLVSGLEPGTHTLIIRVEGKPETSLQFEVVRNQPGLFGAEDGGKTLGAFFRANGEAVTPERPAQAGEIVSIFGTGLGPYRQTPPDGFSVDESAAYSLIDPAEVIAAGERLTPLYAGRGNAGVGVDVVRFTVPATTTASGLLEVRVSVSGCESNSVSLPVVSVPTPKLAND